MTSEAITPSGPCGSAASRPGAHVHVDRRAGGVRGREAAGQHRGAHAREHVPRARRGERRRAPGRHRDAPRRRGDQRVVALEHDERPRARRRLARVVQARAVDLARVDLEQPPELAGVRGEDGGPRPVVQHLEVPTTGGISLKPGDHMWEMKGDMAGAAAVLLAVRALGRLRPDVKVVGILCCAENFPDANAQRPGDIWTAKNGKSVVVDNTDAEAASSSPTACTARARRAGPTSWTSPP